MILLLPENGLYKTKCRCLVERPAFLTFNAMERVMASRHISHQALSVNYPDTHFKATFLARIWRDFCARFSQKYAVNDSSGCWEWVKTLDKKGYGEVWDGEKVVRAHRLSWELFKGAIPPSFHVLHRCDNRRCINPEHLFLGTHQENMDDMKRKNRCSHPNGEHHPKAKLSRQDVLSIYHDQRTDRIIACEYNISRETVNDIKKGKSWRRITGGKYNGNGIAKGERHYETIRRKICSQKAN